MGPGGDKELSQGKASKNKPETGVSRRILAGVSVFWLGLSALFDGLNSLIIPERVGSFFPPGRQALVLGLWTFAAISAGMLVQPIAGSWSDRRHMGRGRFLLIWAGGALAVAALGGLAFSRTPGFSFLFYLAAMVGAGVAQAGHQALMPDLVPQGARGRASGWKGAMDVGGAFLAFALAGVLIERKGPGAATLVLALLLAGTAVGAWALVKRYVRHLRNLDEFTAIQSQEVSGGQGLEGSLGTAVRPGHIRLLGGRFGLVVLSRFLFLLATYLIGRFLLFFIAGLLGVSESQAAEETGALLALLTLLTLLACFPAGRLADRWKKRDQMIAGCALGAAGGIGLAFSASMAAVVFSGFLLALSSASYSVANWAAAADLAPQGRAGLALGIANYATAGAAAIAGALGAALGAPGSDYDRLFFAAAILFVLSALPVGRFRPSEGDVS